MLLKAFGCFCIVLSFFGVKSQRAWGSLNSGYNTGYSNTWNQNNGFSFASNNKPFIANSNNNNAGSWGSDFFIGKPNENSENKKKSDWNYETASTTDKISSWNYKPWKANSGSSKDWQSDEFNKRPNEKKSSSIMNPPNSSSWNSNSNNFPSDTNGDKVSGSYWGSNNLKPSETQNLRPDEWTSNNLISNKPSKSSKFDYEDNSLFPSWSSNDIKKPKPTFNPYSNFSNWESTTQKKKKPGNSKWETNNNNIKPQKPSVSNDWDSNNTTQPGREKTPANSNEKKSSAMDTSILDELDKNDWYFGKESNYPKPPFRSTLNIDVSELWNFNKNKKPHPNSRLTSNNSNYNRRRYRHIKDLAEGTDDKICVCVNVNFCEEEDMIITQEDLAYGMRPLKEFRCTDLTEVCCTNPKIKIAGRTNLYEEKEQLRCGQRRMKDDSLEFSDGKTVKPGEFPWELRIENSKTDCSASLIHHKLALTAAHCVVGAQPDELTLKAGLWNSNNEPPQSRKITKIITHPDYNSQKPRNDIALLVLETPFELTDNVNTICLPVTNDKWDSNQCVVSSWKSEEIRGRVFDVLEKGVVNFLPQAECQNIMLVTDLWRDYVLHDSFVCGVKKTGMDSCTGNEGGFVACPSKKQPNTYLQIGIVSKGMNCDNFGRPGIFTNTLKFLDWINKNYFELELFDNIDIRSLQLYNTT